MGKSGENGFRILYEAIDRMNVEDKGEPELDRVRDMCVDLFRRCLPSLDSTDPVLRLMS